MKNFKERMILIAFAIVALSSFLCISLALIIKMCYTYVLTMVKELYARYLRKYLTRAKE